MGISREEVVNCEGPGRCCWYIPHVRKDMFSALVHTYVLDLCHVVLLVSPPSEHNQSNGELLREMKPSAQKVPNTVQSSFHLPPGPTTACQRPPDASYTQSFFLYRFIVKPHVCSINSVSPPDRGQVALTGSRVLPMVAVKCLQSEKEEYKNADVGQKGNTGRLDIVTKSAWGRLGYLLA